MAQKKTSELKIPPSLMKKAMYLFDGDRQKAAQWFHQTQRFTAEVRPIDAIKTAKGRRAMQAHLTSQIQLAEGIFS
jgi:uncharacterized protein (DUF2384 family)